MTAVARPVVAPPEPWDFPEGSTHDLPNGLRLLTYDVPGQYVVSVRLGLPVSLRDEPREREGVATIMARTLDEGTAAAHGRGVRPAARAQGRQLRGGDGRRRAAPSTSTSSRATSSRRSTCCARSSPSRPSRRPRSPARCAPGSPRSSRSARSPRTAPVSSSSAPSTPPTTGRRGPPAASRETVSSITRDDVAAFHAEHVVAAGVHHGRRRRPRRASTCRRSSRPLSAAGRSGPRDRERYLQHAAALAPDRARIVLVSRPGSVQTEIVIGAPGPGPLRRGRLGALPRARLRPRRLAQRPHRRGPARGEGLHVRHPVELPPASPRWRLPHVRVGARGLDGGVAAAARRDPRERAGTASPTRRSARAWTSSARPRRAATRRPTPSPTRR